MLVSCPSCNKQYHFPPEAYKAPKVRCTACQHIWSPSLERHEQGAEEGLSPLSKPLNVHAHLAEERIPGRQRRFPIKLDWFLLSIGIVVGGFFAYQERDSFFKFLPVSGAEQSSASTETPLVIEGVFYRFEKNKVIVAGEVSNPTANVLDAPPLSLMIRPRHNAEKTYKTWGYRFETTKILPSERVFFETEIEVEETFTPDEYRVYVQFS